MAPAFLALEDFAFQIMQFGGLPPLIRLVKIGTNEQREQAACALQNLANHPNRNGQNIRHQMQILGAIPPLLILARYGTPRQQEEAHSAFHNLARDANGGIHIQPIEGT